MEYWQNFWFILILIIFMIYTLLDGFDLGIGIFLPLFYKDKNDTAVLMNSITPFWDGNEVWLVTGAALFFAVFPSAYAALLSGFYLPFISIVCFFIFRAVSFGFWYHGKTGKKFWEILFMAGSVLAAAAALLAMGNLLQGIPLNENHEYTGAITGLVRPLPAVFMLAGMAALSFQGFSYSLFNTDGKLYEKIRRTGRAAGLIEIVLFLIFFAVLAVMEPVSLLKPFFWAGGIIAVLSLITAVIYHPKLKDGIIFFLSSLAIAGVWTAAGGLLYPGIIKASNNPANSLTVMNASAPLSTLRTLAALCVPALIIVVLYTVFVYRAFGKKKLSRNNK